MNYQILTALALTLAVGCQRPVAKKASQPKPPALPTIVVATVPLRTLEKTVELPTSLRSDQTAMLMPKVEAYVEKVLVDIGDEVTAGQVLIKLSAPELEQHAEQQRLKIARIDAEKTVMAAELAAAQAEVQQHEAQLALKNSEKDGLSQLVRSGAVARRRLEEADFAVQSAAATIARYENAIRVAEARVAQADSELAVAKAMVAESETMAGYLTIKAPFDGVVSTRHVDPGNLVRPGDMNRALLTIAKVDLLRAVMHATTDVAGQLEVGQRVRFVPDDQRDATLEGNVTRLAGNYDEKTRMMRVEVAYDNQADPITGKRPLRSGTYGEATVVLGATSGPQPVVPTSAIRRRSGQNFVVVIESGRTVMTLVKLGLESKGWVEIQSGVSAGSQVVAEKVNAVRDDQEIVEKQLKKANW